MHRSGTSVAARLLNLLGVYLGGEDRLMKAGSDNPTGFWEHRALTELNEEILGCLGGYHLEPPDLDFDWIKHPALEAIRCRARQIVQTDFAEVPRWGWKDPRNSLTLPFWQDLLPPMRYLICLRNPVDVARSVQLRNGISFENGVRLWLKHITHAIRATHGENRSFIFYEDILSSPHEEFRRLAHFADRPELAEQESVRSQVEDFVKKMLQHFHTPLEDSMRDPALGLPAKALLSALRFYVELDRKIGAAGLGECERAAVLDVLAEEIAAANKPYDTNAHRMMDEPRD